MTRKALLIGGPGAPGTSSFLKGVAKDLSSYHSFLRSPLGGAWYSSEIVTLMSPQRDEVVRQIEAIKNADYGFVAFSGHGCHRGSSTYVQLRPGVELDSYDLRAGAPKQTVVLDCCRVVEEEALLERAFAKSAKEPRVFNEADCRMFFDSRIAECAKGLVVLFACGINETASESETNGGYYSGGLVGSAQEWDAGKVIDTTKSFSTYSVLDVHEAASARVKRRTAGRQNPTADYPKTDRQFPFAIIA
jgi:hypothetical protein